MEHGLCQGRIQDLRGAGLIWFQNVTLVAPLTLISEKCVLNSVWMSHVQCGSGVSSECVKRILQEVSLQKWSSRI